MAWLGKLRKRLTETENSEDYWQRTFNALTESMCLISVSGEILQCNQGTERLAGLPREEIIGESWHEVLPFCKGENHDCPVRDAMQNRRRETRDFKHEQGWLEVVVDPVFDEDGEVIGAVHLTYDITERKKAAGLLRDQHRFLIEVMEAIPYPFFVMDANDYQVVMANSAVKEMPDTGDSLLCHALSRNQNAPCKGPDTVCPLDFIRHSKEPIVVEHTLYQPDGEKRIYEVHGYPILDEAGEVRQMIEYSMDITLRGQYEEELRTKDLALASALSPIGMSLLEGKLVYVNDALLDMWGYDFEEELVGHPNLTLWQDPTEPQTVMKALQTEGSWVGEMIGRRKDDSIMEVRVRANMIKSPQGEPIMMMASFEDVTDKKRAEAQINRQMSQISALHDIDIAISSSLDLSLTLNVLTNQVVTQLGVDAVMVLMLDQFQNLVYGAAQGFRYMSMAREVNIRLGTSLAGRVALERKMQHIEDLSASEASGSFAELIEKEEFVGYIGAPLVAKGQLVGVLEIYHRDQIETNPGWINFLDTLAGQAAIAINNAEMFNDLQKAKIDIEVAYMDTLRGWVQALDLRDKETEGHTQRVTDLTLRLARAMHRPDSELIHISRGALLHDIGKMAIPDSILLKPGPLTDEEWEIMKMHPVYARDFLASIDYLRQAMEIPYAHHEWWDGSGYPLGLRGEQIPISARIFAVIDVWDALSSDRPYRKAWKPEKVIEHIKSQSGTHFDPAVVEKFLELMGES